MSLPAAQQRVLDRMEGTLQVSEPHLAGMFAIFTRLNLNEPVGAEPLARPRRRTRWLRHGTALYAFVLVPVMFTMIIIGAMLSGRAHSAGTCEVGYSAGSGSPWISRPWCQVTGNAKTGASRASLASCAARIPAIRFVTRNRNVAVTPPAAATAAVGPPAAC
ncbi:MAG TPA: hypothetical protein VIY52_26990 [Streptosporangiaceae bacterium]